MPGGPALLRRQISGQVAATHASMTRQRTSRGNRSHGPGQMDRLDIRTLRTARPRGRPGLRAVARDVRIAVAMFGEHPGRYVGDAGDFATLAVLINDEVVPVAFEAL